MLRSSACSLLQTRWSKHHPPIARSRDTFSPSASFVNYLWPRCVGFPTPSGSLGSTGFPRQVLPVPRVRRADDLKAPICVEKQRGWKMRSWGMAFWSYECGEAACDCFRQYPPSTSSSDPCQLPVRARVDELGKYINILQDMDPQCSEETF
eukprot:g318.t1